MDSTVPVLVLASTDNPTSKFNLTHTSDAQDSCVDIHGIETQASQNVFIA
jgi:hypothetical protein